MYVCLCNGIKDSELRELARKGVRTAEEAYRHLGVEMTCVDCADYIQVVIDEALDHPTAGRKGPA
jgi:bacterioferritin-associated ferredoxin